MNDDTVEKIAKLLTNDPDVFNEMAVGTGAIAMGMGNVPSRKKRKKRPKEDEDSEDYKANPVTGQPKKGEVLYSDITSEEGAEDSVD